MIVIDATDKILGRLATQVAKKSLLGETIHIINCEKAIISGNKKRVFAQYKKRAERGIHTKGPFLPRMPDRFVRRTIRGMLPYKKPRGSEAFKRILCYKGVPQQFKDEKIVTLEGHDVSKLPYLKYATVEEVCKFLGAKQ